MRLGGYANAVAFLPLSVALRQRFSEEMVGQPIRCEEEHEIRDMYHDEGSDLFRFIIENESRIFFTPL